MKSKIADLLSNPPIIIDGGLSNELEKHGCGLNHKLWSAAVIEQNPEALIKTHYAYAIAGAQILTTASYQASFFGLIDLGYSEEEAVEVILESVRLVQAAIDRAVNEGKIDTRPLIAASIGPYGAYLGDGSEYRGNYGVNDKLLTDFHKKRIHLLAESQADLLAFETIPSFKEAVVLAELLRGVRKPSWVSFSSQDDQCISDSTPVEKVVSLFAGHPSIFAVGVNCTPPRYISALISKMKLACRDKKIIVYPNSGEVFNAETKTWSEVSEASNFRELAHEWVALGADIIGGCCRIGPEQISSLTTGLD